MAIIIIATLLIFISTYDILKIFSNEDNVGTKTEQIYSYINNFKYDYNVNLIKNKYIEDEDLINKNIIYITDLIDNIDLNFNYEFQADKTEDLIYEYEIIGRTKAVYTKNGKEETVLEKDETLKEKESDSVNSDKVDVIEDVKLDLKEKNELITDLKQKMGINVTAQYEVILNISVKTNVQGEEVNDNITYSVKIDLAEKVTEISGENNKSNTEYIATNVKNEKAKPITLVFDIIIIVISLIVLRFVSKAKVANTIRNEYKQELNKILKLCQDKIVMIKTKPDSTEENTTLVRDFGEIVKLSEELFKPILCYIDEENEQAWFSVVSNNVNYRYILKK
jgi:hypothetical protein